MRHEVLFVTCFVLILAVGLHLVDPVSGQTKYCKSDIYHCFVWVNMVKLRNSLKSANQNHQIMKSFNIGIGTMILRFYLMMLVVIIAGFIGQWWIAALAFPIFLSSMLGFTKGTFKQ